MYIVKHNYIFGGMFTNTKAQLHVSAINVGHLQVVHENLSISYNNVCRGFIGCGRG
jgi:dTDP-4-dehydrorhamnose 3,5-epimerase-like enzyme